VSDSGSESWDWPYQEQPAVDQTPAGSGAGPSWLEAPAGAPAPSQASGGGGTAGDLFLPGSPPPNPLAASPRPVRVAQRRSSSATTWIVAAVACAVIALAVGLTASGHPIRAAVAWLLGGLGCVALVALHTLADNRRLVDPWQFEKLLHARLRVAALALGVLAVLVSSWHFADWVARR
jgi:hypothetical protein